MTKRRRDIEAGALTIGWLAHAAGVNAGPAGHHGLIQLHARLRPLLGEACPGGVDDLPQFGFPVRFYERAGLLHMTERTATGYRVYERADIDHVQFIPCTKELGFTLDEIAQLLVLSEEQNSSSIRAAAEQRLAEVESKLAEMVRVLDALRSLVESCRGNAAAGEPDPASTRTESRTPRPGKPERLNTTARFNLWVEFPAACGVVLNGAVNTRPLGRGALLAQCSRPDLCLRNSLLIPLAGLLIHRPCNEGHWRISEKWGFERRILKFVPSRFHHQKESD